MAYCSSCGEEISGSESFCPGCGDDLSDSSSDGGVVVNVQQSADHTTSTDQASSNAAAAGESTAGATAATPSTTTESSESQEDDLLGQIYAMAWAITVLGLVVVVFISLGPAVSWVDLFLTPPISFPMWMAGILTIIGLAYAARQSDNVDKI